MRSVGVAEASRSRNFWLVVAVALFLLQIVILYMSGRLPICECGYVKLWEGGVNTSGNSQHLSDWYTPSHIIHGFLFYGLSWLVLRRSPFGAKLSLAVLIEAAWEVLENSPIIIDRYRTATMALGYTGDSILNSAMDTLFMVLGFMAASRLPVWASVAIAAEFEILTAAVIRDNLTLNVLMLVWPIESIRTWQGALG